MISKDIFILSMGLLIVDDRLIFFSNITYFQNVLLICFFKVVIYIKHHNIPKMG